MKQMMLALAVLAAVVTGAQAADQAAEAGKGKGKAKMAEMTKEQREAMMNKRLEAIKAKDEALY